MDSRPIPCKISGFTLTELMVSIAVATMCATALAGFLFQFSRNSSAIVSFATVNASDRQSLQAIARDFREAESFVYLSRSNISLNVDGATVQLYHDAANNHLMRTAGTNSELLLQNCEALSFSFLERNPLTSNFEHFLVSTSSTCRILELSWVSVVREGGTDRWVVTNSARFLNRRGLSN